ncbi:50S ribosomal protein L29 [Candidatus Uhrbacteria bacterium]|nr:50S ribosomal protein L29 [Candidatus Uhrbacteria bacterium]
MDIKELREKTPLELERLLVEARNRLREMRFKVAAKQLSDVREIRETRQTVARILTLIGQKTEGTAGDGDKKGI